MYLTLKIFSFILSNIPVRLSLFLGRFLGGIFYVLAFRKRRVAYANLKRVFAYRYNRRQIKRILKASFLNFSQNVVEALYLPRIDKAYIDKYIKVEGLHYIDSALKNKKGVIIAGTHFGSWEISSAACSLLGYKYNIIFKEQSSPALNDLLNQYRIQKGSNIVSRGFSIRDIIKSLENNEVVGLAMDQGSVEGSIFVDFFGEPVLIPTGTLRIALKTKSAVIPAYIHRIKGPYHNLVFLPPLNLEGITEEDLAKPLSEYNKIAEGFISEYPEDYTWFYKRWKRSPVRNCLILSDGKAGHLSQLNGLLNIFKKSELEIKENIVEVHFKNKLAQDFLAFCALTSGPYCQGCLSCLKACLMDDSFSALEKSYADIIISCGASLASVNLILKRENQAKSVVIMKPGIFSAKRLDLVVSLKHDGLKKSANVIETDLALNHINPQYLKEQRAVLLARYPQLNNLENRKVAVFLGGPNRNQIMPEEMIQELFSSLKSTAEKLKLELLITTSRRTPRDIEALTRREFSGYPHCKLLIIANEYNPIGAASGMMALSDLIVVSSDSISMVSEAVSSGKPTAVFRLKNLEATKHEKFLENLKAKNYIELGEAKGVSTNIENLLRDNYLKPLAKDLADFEKRIVNFLG